jgi:hypothetical protein
MHYRLKSKAKKWRVYLIIEQKNKDVKKKQKMAEKRTKKIVKSARNEKIVLVIDEEKGAFVSFCYIKP